ncbi:hypothetical protein [Helicobacter sp. 23-1045]
MDCHEVAQSATSRNDGVGGLPREFAFAHSLAMTGFFTHPLNPPPQGRGKV